MKERLKWVNYQVGVWKRADIPQPDLSDPVEGYGWTNENEEYSDDESNTDSEDDDNDF